MVSIEDVAENGEHFVSGVVWQNSCTHVSAHTDVAVKIDSKIPNSSDRLQRCGVTIRC